MFQHVEDLNRFMLRGKKKKRLILYKNSNRCLPNFIFPSCGIFPLPPLLSIHVIPSPPPLFFLSLIKIFFPWLHEREEARNRERERERERERPTNHPGANIQGCLFLPLSEGGGYYAFYLRRSPAGLGRLQRVVLVAPSRPATHS